MPAIPCIVLIEHNAHEAETWYSYFPLVGNEEAQVVLKAMVKAQKRYTYSLEEQVLDLNMVRELPSGTCYMQEHKVFERLIDVSALKRMTCDVLYKGGIERFLLPDERNTTFTSVNHALTAGQMSEAPLLVYAAGPSVFRRDARAFADGLAILCCTRGVESLYPLDGILDPGPLLPWRIREANLQMITRCDAVVADVTPFRGPGMDGGTAYEMGVAAALGKVVTCYTSDHRSYAARVAAFIPVTQEADGALRDANGLQVEKFDEPLFDNLMMSCGVEAIHASYEEALDSALAAVKKRRA